MAKSNAVKQVEVLIQKNDGNTLEWMVLAEASEGKSLTSVGPTVVQKFKHEKGDVVTTYNLNQFLAHSIVR